MSLFRQVCMCVCVRVRESWGKLLDLIGTGMSNVPVNQAGTPLYVKTPAPDENGGRRMNANKSADPWVTFSIPVLQAMRTETGGLGGIQKKINNNLFIQMDKSKVTAGRSRESEISLKRWFPGEGEALPPTDVPVYTHSTGTTVYDRKPPPRTVDDLIRLWKHLAG